MNIWGRVRKNNRTITECVVKVNAESADKIEDWSEPIGDLCHELDLARPVILKKHIDDFNKFSHTYFKPRDFVESVDFDRLEIELF